MKTSENKSRAAKAAIARAGGYQVVAEKMGISIQSVYQWVKNGVPSSRAFDLAKMSGLTYDQVKGEDLQ